MLLQVHDLTYMDVFPNIESCNLASTVQKVDGAIHDDAGCKESQFYRLPFGQAVDIMY